jgi:hypothetical protein
MVPILQITHKIFKALWSPYAVFILLLGIGISLIGTEMSYADCLDGTTPDDGTFLDCPSENASMTGTIAKLHKLDTTCPSPTVKKGSQCVLAADVTLAETLDVASFTKLNCQGHKLMPTTLGSGFGSSRVASVPEVAMVLHGAFGAMIQNCVIGGFDFGVVIVDEKVSEEIKADPGALALMQNKILSNEITSRYQGVAILKGDNNAIKDNKITFTSGGGIGVVIQRDSDLNQIRNNKVTGFGTIPEPVPFFPNQTPIFSLNNGISVFQPSALTLFNILLEGTLIQLPYVPGNVPEDNVIEGNEIQLYSTGNFGFGIGANDDSDGTIVRGNIVHGARTGIIASANGAAPRPIVLPRTCTINSTRLCLSDADCKIVGGDSNDTCPPPPSPLPTPFLTPCQETP